jgi:hypothetical protein
MVDETKGRIERGRIGEDCYSVRACLRDIDA